MAYKSIRVVVPEGDVCEGRFEEILKGIKERMAEADCPVPIQSGGYISKTGGFRAPEGFYVSGGSDLIDYKKEHFDS